MIDFIVYSITLRMRPVKHFLEFILQFIAIVRVVFPTVTHRYIVPYQILHFYHIRIFSVVDTLLYELGHFNTYARSGTAHYR